MALELRIASPCSVKWEAMTGDERVRRCAECKLQVFNIRELKEAEVRALFAKGGRVCGRVFQRADGTVLTKDCPRGVAALRRRMFAALSLAFSFALFVFGYRASERSAPSCFPGAQPSWFERVVANRLIVAREELRDTDSFGELIEAFWPSPPALMPSATVTVTTGLLIMPPRPELPPSRAAGEDGEAERPTP